MNKYLTILYFVTFFCFSQNPAGIWYFGNKAGIRFNSNYIPVSISNGQLETNEGCATLCDENGNLLFYTDGIKVWNRNHQIMPNGNGLNGDPSSTQSAIIVPKPGSLTLYYIFTVDELGKPNGLNYSIIDLTLDGGKGDIITKNVMLFSPSLEKITAVKHANQTDVWIIAHKYNSNTFISYRLSNTGILSAVNSNVGVTVANDTQRTIGYMKSSPNGEYVVCANSGIMSNIEVFKFNNSTGQLVLLATSYFDYNGLGAYGVEFSSNSNVLYISRIDYVNYKSEIYQFDITSQDETLINNSKLLISSQNFSSNNFDGIYASLQLGPDQKIYVARNNLYHLSAIGNPNTLGLGCQFVENGVVLQNQCKFGLPSFVTSYLELNFTAQNFCFNSETNFNTPLIPSAVSYNWNFDDPNSGLSNISNNSNPTHVFSSPGEYFVTLTVETNTTTNIFTKLIKIFNVPTAYLTSNYILCEENDSNFSTFNLDTKINEILGDQNSYDYNIFFFNSLEDLNNNQNILSTNYNNISNPQIIYAKIETLDGLCYDITTFELIVNSNPKIGNDVTKIYCKDSYPDKIFLSAENQNLNDNLSYLWNTGEITESINVNEPGIYTVTATNSSICTKTRIINLIHSEKPIINSVLQGEVGEYTIHVNTTGLGAYVYSLDNEYGNYQLSPTFNNVPEGEHIIFVKDKNGCGISYKSFTVIGYPKYFTPNNDGINDYWYIHGNDIEVISLLIYDRFGKLIQNVVSKNGWDGKYNKMDAIASDYWFVAKIETGETIKGHFSLIR